MSLRHFTSINDLSMNEIGSVFRLAEDYLAELGDSESPSRIASSGMAWRGSIMATLFYEPSTRTRLSFESAMLRLGGSVVSSAAASASSAAKGETLADTVRIVSAYSDLIVLRHPLEGAAKLAAQYADVPVINGGDGAHEHPTQTLCDLFTIQRERGDLAGINVALLGDLKGGRTVHSLAYALARFGAIITAIPAVGLELPDSVDWRLRNEFGYRKALGAAPPGVRLPTATYLPGTHPDRPALIDVLYVTRFQKERTPAAAADYPTVDSSLLSDPDFARTLVLHPLPRVDELDPALDPDPRAAYFRQAAYGVAVRMALTALLLDHGFGQAPTDPGATHIKSSEVCLCENPACVSRDPVEAPRAPATFKAIAGGRLRCLYCEHDTIDAGRC